MKQTAEISSHLMCRRGRSTSCIEVVSGHNANVDLAFIPAPVSLAKLLSMATLSGLVLPTLLVALCLANSQLSHCQVLKAKVTCLDCHKNYDFSGIKVSVKCAQVKKVAMATTEADGSFEAKLPSDVVSDSPAAATPHCLAEIVGGTTQLYVSSKLLVSQIVKTHDHDSNSYIISTLLGFSTSCPLSIQDQAACKAKYDLGSSKTVNLPLPQEWGLAPSSFYIPFIPIIGIP